MRSKKKCSWCRIITGAQNFVDRGYNMLVGCGKSEKKMYYSLEQS